MDDKMSQNNDRHEDLVALAKVYGDVMMKIGRLEERVDLLIDQLQSTNGLNPSPPEHAVAPTSKSSGARDHDSEQRHMTNQIARMANQLAETERGLARRNGSGTRHSSRRHAGRPWWKKLRQWTGQR